MIPANQFLNGVTACKTEHKIYCSKLQCDESENRAGVGQFYLHVICNFKKISVVCVFFLARRKFSLVKTKWFD